MQNVETAKFILEISGTYGSDAVLNFLNLITPDAYHWELTEENLRFFLKIREEIPPGIHHILNELVIADTEREEVSKFMKFFSWSLVDYTEIFNNSETRGILVRSVTADENPEVTQVNLIDHLDTLENLTEEFDCDLNTADLILREFPEAENRTYQGHHSSKEDFGKDIFCQYESLSSHLESYFDFGSYADSLLNAEYTEINGHYFREH